MKSAGNPNKVLLILTLINLINYVDRYILVALSPTIKQDLSLSDTQVGFLTTAFMLSYFLISPVFGWLGERYRRYPVMSTGIGLWSIATAASGFTRSFSSLLYCRFSVGVGEAAYGSISPSVISDLYPKSKSGKVFALFFMAIPVGSALGYVMGGILEKFIGWRAAFWVAGIPGILLAVALLFFREPKRGQMEAVQIDENSRILGLREIYYKLFINNNYVLTVLGYCAYTFVLGGVAAWIPHYMHRTLQIENASGNMIFGAVTVAAGLLGTILGGAWADAWAKKGTDAYLKLSGLSVLAAIPIYFFVLQATTLPVFVFWVFLLEFLLFLSTSPINAQIVNCVPPNMRATAGAVAIFSIHLLGDAISPPLVGFLSTRSSLPVAMQLFYFGLLASALIWLAKVVFYWEALPWPKEALELPKSQCHRGYYHGLEENTLVAFRAAAAAGAKMVELDVRLSKDQLPAVIHDKDLKRTLGIDKRVADLTLQELTAQGIPSLEDILTDPACSELFVNIEIKCETGRPTGIEKAVADVVAKGFSGRVIFSSFNPLVLRRISSLLPNVPRALLVSGEIGGENKFYLRRMLLACVARPHMVNLDQNLYTVSCARGLAGRGIPVAIWTVDNIPDARKFLAMGAKSIISPIPGKI